MKRYGILLLAFVYLTLVTGIVLKAHYCGGRLISVNFSPLSKEHSCGCDGKAMKKDCCKKTQFVFKLKIDNRDPDTFVLDVNKFVKGLHSPIGAPSFNCSIFPTDDVFANQYHSPPPTPENPLYLQNRVFLI